MRTTTFTLLIHLLFLGCTASELKIVGVGQASFSMVISGDRGMVFDCGVQTKRTWIDSGKNIILSPKDILIKSCLEGVKNLTIVISHNHDDHHNLLVPLCRLAIELKLRVNIIKSWEKSNTEIEAAINGALGPEVAIRPLFPERREGHVHDYCLVLKLSVNGRNILLTGDASGRLVEQISGNIMDTDVLLLSHHGSDESRELSLVDVISERDLSPRPLLGIVSSNVFGASRIPRYYPGYRDPTNPGGTFLERMDKTAIPLSGMSGSHFCRYHSLTFYDQLIDSEYTAPAIVPEPLRIIPVFSTGDLGQNLFYQILINPDGSISMYKHGEDIPLYYVGVQEFVFPGTFNSHSEILSGITDLTRKSFENWAKSYAEISPVFQRLPHDGLPLDARSLTGEAHALLTLKYSTHISDAVRLERLVNLLIPISKDRTILFAEKRSENLLGRLKAFDMWTPTDRFNPDFAEFLLQNKFFSIFEDSDQVGDLTSLLWMHLSKESENQTMIDWLEQRLQSELSDVDVENRAERLLFLKNYDDQTAWNLYILRNNLLGDNYPEVSNFLVKSLYASYRHETPLRSALVESLKHYSTESGYVEHAIYYDNTEENRNWVSQLLGDPENIENFGKFLIDMEIFG